ncbi:MAG: nitrate/nitrite transporter NrtS [Deltaproteobacteria bacterium]|nr:nitrate/nitrite transporter NrtS [Deltaproteobacteria bacterium]
MFAPSGSTGSYQGRDILLRAGKYDRAVGFVLIAINHGDALLDGRIWAQRMMRMILTVMVFCLYPVARSCR